VPIDALKAFVDVFGCPISVGDKKALFVDPQQFPFDANVKVEWTGAPPEFFVTFSQTTNSDTRLFRVGLAYCIDVPKYRTSLKKHGVKIHEPTPSMVSA
jgi:acyl-CoA thioesterase